ncbi:MAG: hypothetical protein KDC46_07640 [Thermoleophilia bacterium]|nr:hypothetical protein [Thermoleophilia bacterium]
MDLAGSIRQLDGAIVAIDHAIVDAVGRNGYVSLDLAPVRAATDQVEALLGSALPDAFCNTGSSLTNGGYASKAFDGRVRLARLGAAARSVQELGGPEAVAARGGLDAIDGAVDIYRSHLAKDVGVSLDTLQATLENRLGMFDSKGEKSAQLRSLWIDASRALAGARELGMDTSRIGTKTDHIWSASVSNRGYRNAVHDAEDLLGAVRGYVRELPKATTKQTEQLHSSIAHAEAARASIDLPAVQSLAAIEDPAAAVAAAPATLAGHLQLLDALSERVAGHNYYQPEWTELLAPFRSDLVRIADDIDALKPLLADGPESAEAAAAGASEWIRYGDSYLAESIRGRRPLGYDNVSELFTNSSEDLRELKTQIERMLDDPSLTHVRSDVRDEVRELLDRPGELDVAALRDVFEGDAPETARRAFVEAFADGPLLDEQAAAATTTDEAIRRLDEAALISDAVQHIARTAPENRAYWLALDEPGIRDAIRDTEHRRMLALGMSELVPPGVANGVKSNAEGTIATLNRHDTAEPYQRVMSRTLTAADDAATKYRDTLIDLTQRAQRDGGLRTITPSERPDATTAAAADWIVRELDRLEPLAVDASSDAHVDQLGRRLSLLADLSRSIRPDDAKLARLRSELGALDNLWRAPDDVALEVARLRSLPDDALARAGQSDGLTATVPYRLRQAVEKLRAWTMFDDGVLPSTDVDRLAVAARRASNTARVDPTGNWVSRKPIEARNLWLQEMDARVIDIESLLGTDAPRDALRAVRATRGELQRDVDAAMQLGYQQRERWVPDQAHTTAYRDALGRLAREVEQLHVDARAAAQATGG